MSMPKVSIIIPVYNGSKYLKEAIESALHQTYENIEVIVVNDGSEDAFATRNVALHYYGEDVHLIKYIEKKRGGVASALNEGIAAMQGEYFTWLSHDDLYEPDKIKNQMDLLASLEDATTVIYGGYKLMDEAGEITGEVRPGNVWQQEELNKPLFPVFKGLLNGCSLLIHRSHFDRVGRFDTTLKACQDTEMWFRILKEAKICYLDTCDVKTRIHGGQDSNKQASTIEVNNGWIRRMHQVTSKEMKQLMGSDKQFYLEVAKTLACFSKYKMAHEEALRLSELYTPSLSKDSLVSVIIPFYNKVELVVEAVESVRQQTYPYLEILLISDGCEENLGALQLLCEKDKRVKLITAQHKGSGAARNKGIELATGEYIAFLDSDDLWLPEKIERQLAFMKENELMFSHTSYERVTRTNELLKTVASGTFCGIVFPRILYYCFIATPTVMVKKAALGKRRFQEDMGVSQDVCLWIDLAYDYELGGLDEVLAKVRVDDTTTCFNVDKVKRGYFNVLTHIYAHPEYLKEREAIEIFLKKYTGVFSESFLK